MSARRLVPVGRIAAPHGVRGWVRLVAYGETLPGLTAGELLYYGPQGRQGLTLTDLKPQKNAWLASFEELFDRDAAERVTGCELHLPEDRLPAPEEDEYYHYQLIGLRVVDVGGTDLGAISAILETGSNDVYVVVREGREILVPGIHEVVRGVDLEAGCMYVDLPEGLVE